MEKELYSTNDLARLLGVSRIAIFKRIQAGKIKAKKVGRNFVIPRKELPEILGNVLTKPKKRAIDAAVKKTVREYGQTLKLLGRE